MKIAVSATGPNLESEVDPRFGRCQYFIVVDLDDMSFEALPNTNLAQGSGVGIQSAKVVADRGARAVLTGNIGPNARDVLSEVGVDVITGVSGTVGETARQYKQGRLADSGAGRRMGYRPGMGRGRGCGRGMGRGIGRGMYPGAGVQYPNPVTREEELAYSKEDAQRLREQLKEIERRMKKLENEKAKEE